MKINISRKKVIFNYLTRILVDESLSKFYLKNPENKKSILIEEGLGDLLALLYKFRKPKFLKDVRLNNHEKEVMSELLSSDFIIPYNKGLHQEYLDKWEGNNWEDFLYFLKSIGNYEFVDTRETAQDIIEAKENLFSDYLKTNSDYGLKGFDFLKNSKVVELSTARVEETKDFFKAIMERRTIRNFNYQKISFDEFSWILREVLYEVKQRKTISLEHIEDSLANFTNSHSLWLQSIISVNRVEGIENGFYLYDYMKHSLIKIKNESTYDDLQRIIIGQKFMRGSAFSVFVSVDFYNIFWRYRYPGTYKAALISSAELGHKLTLAANALGLGVFSTPAVRDINAEEILGTKPAQIESIYYIAIGKYNKQKSYSLFSRYYDEIMGDRKQEALNILKLIQTNHKNPKTILDIACGSGVITDIFYQKYKIEGIDSSKEMLKEASSKFPHIQFTEADMTKFDLKNKYDVITCNFDSVNHLTSLKKWEDFFFCCQKHLKPKGVMIFDINTLGKLKKISKFEEFNTNVGDKKLSMKVDEVDKDLFSWTVKYLNSDNNLLFEESILETSFELKRIKQSLKKYFSKVKVIDFNKDNTQKDDRLFFVCSNH